MPSALITGANGYLGRHFLQSFHQAYPNVLVDALLHRTDYPLPPGMRWTPVAEVGSHGPYNFVFHFAACYGRGGETIPEILEGNVLLPNKLFASGACDGALFVNAGTGLPPTVSAYALSKEQFRQWLEWHAPAGGVVAVNVRLQHFYGPGDSPAKFPTWLLGEFRQGKPWVELTQGHQVRDFIHIRDAVDGLMRIVAGAGDFKSGTLTDIPLGSGEGVSLAHFCCRLRELAGAATELRFGAKSPRPGEPDIMIAETGWLQERGWRPSLGLEDGLRKFVEDER